MAGAESRLLPASRARLRIPSPPVPAIARYSLELLWELQPFQAIAEVVVGPAAVNKKSRARDVACARAREPDQRFGDFLGRSRTAQWDTVLGGGLDLVREALRVRRPLIAAHL